MLVDANVLLYAVHNRADRHQQASAWLTEQLNGPRRIGLPWQSIKAFLRISTHPRAFERPLDPPTAWERVTDWLAAPVAWVPQPGPEYGRILGDLIATYTTKSGAISSPTRVWQHWRSSWGWHSSQPTPTSSAFACCAGRTPSAERALRPPQHRGYQCSVGSAVRCGALSLVFVALQARFAVSAKGRLPAPPLCRPRRPSARALPPAPGR